MKHLVSKIKDAVMNRQKIVWNDPELIEGNDYTVRKIWNIDEETAMIQYGEDDAKWLSEAEVYLTELTIIPMNQFRITWRHEVIIEAETPQEARDIWEQTRLGSLDHEESVGHIIHHDFVEEVCFEDEDYNEVTIKNTTYPTTKTMPSCQESRDFVRIKNENKPKNINIPSAPIRKTENPSFDKTIGLIKATTPKIKTK